MAFFASDDARVNNRITTKSEITTTPSTVRVTGPSAWSSSRSATTTAGDCAASITPSVKQTMAACVGGSAARNSSSPRNANRTAVNAAIVPITAITVIQPIVRNSDRMARNSISAPAVRAISEMAMPLKSRSRPTISSVTSSSA